MKYFYGFIAIIAVIFLIRKCDDWQEKKQGRQDLEELVKRYENDTVIKEDNQLVNVPKDENCYYTKATISTQINDSEIEKKIIEGCFEKENAELGLIEIKDKLNKLKVTFYNNDTSILNTTINGNLIEWRKRDGHDIFINDKGSKLNITFGDRNSSVGKVKSMIEFE